MGSRRKTTQEFVLKHLRGSIPAAPLTIILACVIGVAAGFGAIVFTHLIVTVGDWTVRPALEASGGFYGKIALVLSPALGLLLVSWFTRRYAPEAEGHGVPEVITSVARRDGVIRPHVALVKILASGFCIGTGGSIGREGPIVQIGAALGSASGQMFKLSARNIKVLVAAGAAAGIAATFHAPLSGVIFASEIILGSFAVESLTPIVIAAVLADVVQQNYGEHRQHSAFAGLHYDFTGAWEQLPTYMILGLVAGLMAVLFTKLLYFTEDVSQKAISRWWLRALVLGSIVGLSALMIPATPPKQSAEAASKYHAVGEENEESETRVKPPALFGVGYEVVDHTLRLRNVDKPPPKKGAHDQGKELDIYLDRDEMLAQLWWLVPLIFLKPLLTCITLAGGGSGGIFAPSLFVGATLGAGFGIVVNLLVPGFSANPGVYAIVGMGAVVAGTTHGTLSAILIVYEMTDDYRIILPIMIAAGLSSTVACMIDPESIYYKKLTRRGENIQRGQDMHVLEHIMIRDMMVVDFPSVPHSANLIEIVRVARANSHFESLPVMNEAGKLIGIIRPEDLHRVLDTDLQPQLVYAADIALLSPIAVSPDENLLEAVRDFGTRDVETLPVEIGTGEDRELVGLLLRSDVMDRYREELLRR